MARTNRQASTNGQRAVGYLRRSTDRQEQSIADQKKAVEQYAKEHSCRIVDYYIDDAISGANTLGRRAFQKMIQDAQQEPRKFDSVIVYDVKRFGRIDNDEAGYYRHILRTHGVEIYYTSENFNGDATDDLLRPVKQWQARQELKDLSKVTIRGLISKVGSESGHQKGAWMGGCPAYGYDLLYRDAGGKFLFIVRYEPDGTKLQIDEQGKVTRTLARGESMSVSKRDHCHLVPSSPHRVAVLQRIFRMYAHERKGYKAIAETLNAENVPTARGPQWSHIYSGKWTDTTIRAILVNPIYVGDMVWNRRTDARFFKISDGRAVERDAIHGHRLVPNDENDWIIVRDAHPALIDRHLFEQAKALLASKVQSIEQRGRDPRKQINYRGNNHGKSWRGQRSRFILSGLLTCNLCGNRYQGLHRAKGKRRWDGSRVKTYSYGCGGHITKGNSVCQLNPISQALLESTAIKALLDAYRVYLEPGGQRRLAEAVRQQLGTEAEELIAARQRIQTERAEIEISINRLLDNLTATNREFVDQRLEELRERRAQLQRRDEELECLELAQQSIDATVADVKDFLDKLAFTLREGVPQEKLVALRQCIERVLIDRPAGQMKLRFRIVPASHLTATEERMVALPIPDLLGADGQELEPLAVDGGV